MHKLINQFKNNMDNSNLDELLCDYEIIEMDNENIISNEFINLNVLNESQLDNLKLISSENPISKINMSNDNMIIFDAVKFIKKILKSYNSNITTINYQFNVDFKRSELIFDNFKIKDIQEAINLFDKYSQYNFNENLKLNILLKMICTQASFAFSFLLMHKMFTNNVKNIFVTSNDIKYVINNNGNLINIILKATYNLKNTKNNVNINKINVDTFIDFVYKNNKYNLCDFGIITWMFQDNH